MIRWPKQGVVLMLTQIVIKGLLIRVHPKAHKNVENWCESKQLERHFIHFVVIAWWSSVKIS